METQILQSLILEVTEVLVQGSMHLSGKFAKDSKFKLLSIGRVQLNIHQTELKLRYVSHDLT